MASITSTTNSPAQSYPGNSLDKASANLDKQAQKLAEKYASKNITDSERQKIGAAMQSINGAQKGISTMRGGGSPAQPQQKTSTATTQQGSTDVKVQISAQARDKAIAATTQGSGGEATAAGQAPLKSKKYGIELVPRNNEGPTATKQGTASAGAQSQTTQTSQAQGGQAPSTTAQSSNSGTATAGQQGITSAGTATNTTATTTNSTTNTNNTTTNARQSSSMVIAAENLNQKNEAARAALNNLEKAYGGGTTGFGSGRLNLTV